MILGLAAAALVGVASLAGPPVARTDSLVGPDHVPFMAQSPLLCGGAAGAMILRFWGERGVYGEDFAHLVREREGGIATADLTEELRRAGYRVRVADGPGAVFEALEAGIPSILLLEGHPTLHYVVLVRADDRHAWLHDPNFGPDRRLHRTELTRRWRASGYWALIAVPEDRGMALPDGRERTGHAVRADSPPTPALDSAMVALRSGHHDAARALAHRALRPPRASPAASDLERRLARRILATSHYLDGHPEAALRHWNALSEPRIDLVEIRGARHTRHHALAARVGLPADEILTPRGLAVARRRLAEVDALERTRVDYRPIVDGTVEVRAFVQERPRWMGLREGLVQAARAAVDRRVSLEIGPLMAAGDRWSVDGRLGDAQSFAAGGVSTTVPAVPGLVSLGLEWRRERFPVAPEDAAPRTEERVRAWVGLREWVTPALRLDGGLALERWVHTGRMASARMGWLWARGDDIRVSASVEHWRGSATPFTRVDLGVEATRRLSDATEARMAGGAVATTSSAPPLVWPGAGTGEIRDGLLRGHPLASGRAIDGDGFGRHLLHATLEYRAFRRVGPVRLGVGAFLDGARAWKPAGAGPVLLDPGVGAFLDTGAREIRLDLARGEGRWVLSARVASSG